MSALPPASGVAPGTLPAAASAVAAQPASAAASAPGPAASTDPDAPTPLTSATLKGQGLDRQLSYYYSFKGGPGAIKLKSLDWRVRFEGPHDFEPCTPPQQVTIALDAAVLFDTGKSQLKPEARQTLHEAAERIKKFADVPVAITGHTDNVGADAANQVLSEMRAKAVLDHLVQQEGVPAARLTAKGHGKGQPVADNTTEAGRARNRRVDVVISVKR